MDRKTTVEISIQAKTVEFTGVAVTELVNATKTVMWSDALDKWLAW